MQMVKKKVKAKYYLHQKMVRLVEKKQFHKVAIF